MSEKAAYAPLEMANRKYFEQVGSGTEKDPFRFKPIEIDALLSAARLALRALTEKPPIGKSYAEVVSSLQQAIRQAEAA